MEELDVTMLPDEPPAGMFEDIQQTFNRLTGARLKVAQADPAMGENLKQATVAVLEQWRKELG